jgi:hypothetical protein
MKNLIIFIFCCTISLKIFAQDETSGNYATPVEANASFIKNANEMDSVRINVWPNPAKNIVNIFINDLNENEKGQLVIYNMSGNAVLTKNINHGNNQIYLDNISGGLYIIRIIRENEPLISTKLIVAR